jgi:hypothetical protein
MRIFSTQSKGYDTTAVNALATPFGVDAAFTVTRGKGKGRYADHDADIQPDDDGTEICQVLGIRPIPLDRRLFEQKPLAEEALYACLDENQDSNLLGVADHISGPSLLLTGCLGEIWYPTAPFYLAHPELLGSGLSRVDLGNHGLSEIRLHIGFVQVAVPFIGGRRRSDILRISESEEMRPWNVQGDYNRPIPRRIAEEAGVPRLMFGQVKMASVVEFARPDVFRDSDLQLEYRSFLIRNRVLSPASWAILPLVRRINTLLHFSGANGFPWRYYLERTVARTLGPSDFHLPELWRSLNGRIFCFAANRCADSYAARLT